MQLYYKYIEKRIKANVFIGPVSQYILFFLFLGGFYMSIYKLKKKKVFLGGTCNNSTWRNTLIPMLNIEYFNPVVPNWTPECQKEEIKQRKICDYSLYVITSEMTGVYSIAEVVDDSNKRPKKTILCVIKDNFTDNQIKSLESVKRMVSNNGAKVFDTLEEVANYLNA